MAIVLECNRHLTLSSDEIRQLCFDPDVHEMTDEQIDQELKQLLAKPGAVFGNG